MQRRLFVIILVLLSLTLPASTAQASGVVSVCDEIHLLAALAGGGTVTLTCNGTISLTKTITISANTTIDGSGRAVTISGDNQVRVFYVNSLVTLSLIGLAIANGNSPDDGGGIYNNGGTVIVNNSTFTGNSAFEYGGGIYNNVGAVSLSNSSFSVNSAFDAGGGIYNAGGDLSVSNSTFTDNSAFSTGGGILNAGSPLTIINSTFSGNNAAAGGGIYNESSTATVSGSTFSGNYASTGGGILNSGGDIIVSNSTFFENSADMGGGISNGTFSTVTVRNSTFSGNSASVAGGSIHNNDGMVNLGNTILANSPSGGNCSGTITDDGGNLTLGDPIEAPTCPGINSDPKLGPLQDNGGPTHTMALSPESPAIDAGEADICSDQPVNNLDQRKAPRPINGDGVGNAACDIGSFEYIPTASTMTSIITDSPDPSQAGGLFTVSFTVTSEIGVPSGEVTVTVSGSPASCSAALMDGAGSCELALEEPGAYTLTANYDGEFFPPSSDSEPHSVVASTTINITGDNPDPSKVGEPFTVAFVVTSDIGAPTGAVTVKVSGSPASCSADLVDGSGSCELTIDTPGAYTLTADYDGAYFLPSSDTEPHTVEAATHWIYLPLINGQ